MQAPPNTRREFIYKDRDELLESLAFWQSVLRLQDWTIDVRQVRGNGLNMVSDSVGRCRPVLTNKMATIGIIDPVDYDPECSFPLDQEWLLVHELLHLHLEPIAPDVNSPLNFCTEQALESITCGLISLKKLVDKTNTLI